MRVDSGIRNLKITAMTTEKGLTCISILTSQISNLRISCPSTDFAYTERENGTTLQTILHRISEKYCLQDSSAFSKGRTTSKDFIYRLSSIRNTSHRNQGQFDSGSRVFVIRKSKHCVYAHAFKAWAFCFVCFHFHAWLKRFWLSHEIKLKIVPVNDHNLARMQGSHQHRPFVIKTEKSFLWNYVHCFNFCAVGV